MPVGGRINRKEKLRSKASSTKANINEEKETSKKSSDDKIPGLKLLALLKETNATRKSIANSVNVNITATKDNMPQTVDEIKDVLELNAVIVENKLEPDVRGRMNSRQSVHGSKVISMEVDEPVFVDSVGKADLPKTKSTVKRTTDVHIEELPAVSSIKNTQRRRKEVDNVNAEITNMANDNILKSGTEINAHKVKATPTKSRTQRNLNIPAAMDILEEDLNTQTINITEVMAKDVTNTPKVKATPTKSRTQRNLNKPVAMDILEEDLNTQTNNITEAMTKDVSNTPIVKETPTKSRAVKKIKVTEVMEPLQEDVNVATNNVTDLNLVKETPTKCRNLRKINAPVFIEEEVASIIVDEALNKDVTVAKTRGRKPRVAVQDADDKNVQEVKPAENTMMEIDDVEVYSKVQEKKHVPKIVAKENTAKPSKVVTNVTPVVPTGKIPGLALLQNLKNRKSGIINPFSEDQGIAPAAKIPGLESTADIRRRKSQIVPPTTAVQIVEEISAPLSTVETVEEILPKSTKKTAPKPLPVPKEVVAKKLTLTNPPSRANEKIPGLLSIAEIRRRKSMLLECEEVVTKQPNQDNDIIPESKRRKSTLFDDKHSIIAETPEATIKVATPTKKPTKNKIQLPESPKIPGFSVIEEIRNRKSAKLTPLKSDSEKLPILASNQSPLSSRIPLFSSDLILTPGSKRPPLPPTASLFSASQRPSLFSPSPSTNTHKPSNSYMIAQSPLANQKPAPLTNQKPAPLTNQFSSPIPTPKMPSILRTPVSSFLVGEPSIGLGRSQSSIASSKRPMSCLDNDCTPGPREKMARIVDTSAVTPSDRRRSVTFSDHVAMKEIQGNSFNSGTDDDEIDALRQEMELKLEKTKNALVAKRLNPTNNNPTVRQYGAVRSLTFSSTNIDATKKGPTLLDDKLEIRKAQYKAGYNYGNVQPPTTGPNSFSFIKNYCPDTDMPDQRSRFGSVKPTITNKPDAATLVTNLNSNEISDDEMDVPENTPKSSCSIM